MRGVILKNGGYITTVDARPIIDVARVLLPDKLVIINDRPSGYVTGAINIFLDAYFSLNTSYRSVDLGEIYTPAVDIPDFYISHVPSEVATGFVVSGDRKVPIAAYQLDKDTIVVFLNRVLQSPYDVIVLEMAQVLTRVKAALGVERDYADVTLAAKMITEYAPRVAFPPINQAFINETPEYRVILSIKSTINVKIELRNFVIRGYSDGSTVYACEGQLPRVSGTITMKWHLSGVPVMLRADLNVRHENIDEDGNICLGEWSLPKIETERPLDEQVNDIVTILLEMLRYPNVASAFHEGVGTGIMMRHQRGEIRCKEIGWG